MFFMGFAKHILIAKYFCYIPIMTGILNQFCAARQP